MPKKFAVILAGCGNKDGAEIHESVLTLLAIDKHGCSYQCFAPDVDQKRVLNYLTNEELPEKRNVLIEAARIARSNIKALTEFRAEDFDILVLPGGSGVAYNLCSFAADGANMSIVPEVASAVTSMHQKHKPIGALCIAPVILAKLIPGVTLTFGADEKVNTTWQPLGVKTQNIKATEIVVDQKNKIVTTPCYMLPARISELSEGIEKLIVTVIQMS